MSKTKMEIDYKFQSNSVEWGTPPDFFDKLNRVFGFSLDVAANELNKKCERFFSKEMDGLKQEWEGVCWMNPPYGRELTRWVKKAWEESEKGNTVVCLIPSKTDTLYYQNFVFPYARAILFIKGRLKFVSGKKFNSAPSPNNIVVFSQRGLTKEQISTMKELGFVIYRSK